MKNITKEYLDKLEQASFVERAVSETPFVTLEGAKNLLQDFEVALLNEIDNQKKLTNKQSY